MRRLKRFLALSILALCAVIFCSTGVNASGQGKRLDVMFLHDVHSHLEPFATVSGGESKELGGFSRIKTLINRQKSVNPDTLLLDAGDFSMGTLVQTVFEEEASELRMLGALGFDVTTLGNHEFDYRSQGLANMLITASSAGDAVPRLVLCNVDWEGMEKAGLTEEQALLRDAFDRYGIKDYTVITKGDVKIAVIGIFGKDSLICAPTCVLQFRDAADAVKNTVDEIRKNENVDMIACVSHSGVWEDKSKSEDELLAKAVPDIDLIISGHTHTELTEPIRIGDTYIVSCGEYGKNLGSLSMVQKDDGRWSMASYELIPVTDDVERDGATEEKAEDFLQSVNQKYLSRFGYTRDQVLAENDIEFCTVDDLMTKHEELNLGSIISDAYVYAVNGFGDDDPRPVDVAVAPSGTIRDTYAKGDVTVTDVFNSFSLGIGEDRVPGYPLLSVYLTGSELKAIAEIDASISDYNTSARLYMSGLNMSYNPHRLILNKVTECYLTTSDGQRHELENKKLYRVVTDLYTGQMLGAITDMSYGIISIVPKNKDGQKVENLADLIITSGGSELKAWDAIAKYMQSFEDTDGNGTGNIPSYYATTHGRKVVIDSKNLIDLLKNPSKYAVMIVSVVLVIFLVIVLVVVLIVKFVRKRRK